MHRKLALKKLTHSDLTFFKRYFDAQAGSSPSKQKAINLNKDILIDRLYPGLTKQKHYTELEIQGPGPTALPQTLTRKILLGSSSKNWRLNGELIPDPEEDRDRYADLIPGDLVVFEFFDNNNGEPDRIRLVLLSQKLSFDQQAYDSLSVLVRTQTMVSLSEKFLIEKVKDAMPDGHALESFMANQGDLELIVQGVYIDPGSDLTVGGVSSNPVLTTSGSSVGGIRTSDFNRSAKPSLRRVSAETLQKARVGQEENGRIGEELVNAYFTSNPRHGVFEWSSKINIISPYDFKRTDDAAGEFIDVKTTSGGFETPFHISLNEIRQAASAPGEYHIYRVFNVYGNPEMRISGDIKSLAKSLIEQIQGFIAGVIPDGFTLSPRLLEDKLNFGEVISLDISEE